MTDTDSTKRIPKSMGTDAKLFSTYTLTDLAVALVPGVMVVLVLQVLLPTTATIGGVRLQTFTLPFVGVAVAIGAVFVYLTPAYTTSLDWVVTFIGYQRAEAELTHEDAKAYTHVERVHPEIDAVERTDGAFVGFVRVRPPTMALATDEEWGRTAEAFREFCNTAVQFPVQLYATTQPFPIEEYLGRYESRLSDPDVKDNPNLGSLIENYVEWYASDLEERRMTIRDHYVVVPVTPAEVHFEEASLTQKLAMVPLLGLFIRARYAPRRAAERASMIDELDERLRQVEAGLREIDGCSARRVDAEAATELLAEFWSGESRSQGNTTQQLRGTPIVGGLA